LNLRSKHLRLLQITWIVAIGIRIEVPVQQNRNDVQTQIKRSTARAKVIPATYTANQTGSRCPASLTTRAEPMASRGSCSPSSTKMMPLAANWIRSHTALRRIRVTGSA
jgi:hypothetical protein